MSSQKVIVLGSNDALGLGKDAKIVAVRWDLIPWALVLDCDVPAENETENSPTRRAWMVFRGLSDLSWSLESARLPNGLNCIYDVAASQCADGFCTYELPVLAPMFSGAGQLNRGPHQKIVIRAKSFLGAVSTAASVFGEFGPDRIQRNLLANEDDFLGAVGDL